MIERVKNKIKKELNLMKGSFLSIESPSQNQRVDTPFLKISGFVVDQEDIDIDAVQISIEGKSYSVYEIETPDLKFHYPKKQSKGFQIVINGESNWQENLLVVITYKDSETPLNIIFNTQNLDTYIHDRTSKLNQLKNIVSSQFGFENEAILSISKEQFSEIETTGNVSDHDYDPTAKAIINEFKDGFILDAGCGLRSVYYPNVVNLEIVDYPTTDVIGFADKLPFPDNTFDAVFSLNVLEHVRDPFTSAKELERVLKPGGKLYVAVPFLQPFHGYPNHYYNMTTSGLKNLFSDKLTNVDCGVLDAGHPIYALSWMLTSYKNGLSASDSAKFGELSVNELIGLASKQNNGLIASLNPKVQEELSCVNYLLAEKL